MVKEVNTETKTNNTENKMTRGEFLKKTAVGAVAAAIALKFGGGTVNALASSVQVDTDNKESKSNNSKQYVGAIPPVNKDITWIDTTAGGVMKYWNGTEWTPVRATWG